MPRSGLAGHASAPPSPALVEQSARRAYLDALFGETAREDHARPRNRVRDRRLRFLTVRFPPGPFDAQGLGQAKKALASIRRALQADFDVRRYAGAFAYGQRWGGWHAHLVIDSKRIDQGLLAGLAVRLRHVSDIKVNLLRLPDEAIHDGRILRPDHFKCPDARDRLFSTSFGHFDYVAAQPLDAPRGCTLWIDSEPAGTWIRFRTSYLAALRVRLFDVRTELGTIGIRRTAFTRARGAALRQNGRHIDRWSSDEVSTRVWPGRGRLRYVDLSAIPCPVCAA